MAALVSQVLRFAGTVLPAAVGGPLLVSVVGRPQAAPPGLRTAALLFGLMLAAGCALAAVGTFLSESADQR